MTLQFSLHHTSFPVTDLERSRAFYGGLLGLLEIPRPDIFGVKGAWFAAGDCEVHLIETPQGADVGRPPGSINPAGRHAAFATPSYAEALAHMQSRDREVFETNEAIGQLWVRDPDGHVLEFVVPSRSR